MSSLTDDVDCLSASLATSFGVSQEENSTSAQHPRYALYKAKKSGISQEDRRQKILNEQKRRRFDSLKHVRSLAEDEWSNAPEEEATEPSDGMDLENEERQPQSNSYYRDQLMMSEWLIDVPADFEEEWLMVACPPGKRTLVIASKGKTWAYNKGGYLTNHFQSRLPGAHNRPKDYTVLDCIYDEALNTYYVLDIMCWGGHPVYDSETEFRFYWMHSKIQEIPELTVITKRKNPNKFIPLPSFPCTQTSIHDALEAAQFKIDGLLFYHKRAHYTLGTTPLVVWLKSYMVPEILSIQVPEVILKEKPETYTNFADHIEKVKLKKAKKEAKDLELEQRRQERRKANWGNQRYRYTLSNQNSHYAQSGYEYNYSGYNVSGGEEQFQQDYYMNPEVPGDFAFSSPLGRQGWDSDTYYAIYPPKQKPGKKKKKGKKGLDGNVEMNVEAGVSDTSADKSEITEQQME